jgi:hypothetical protein
MNDRLRYYDDTAGRFRYKRRYKWAIGAFCVGALFGAALAHLI